MEIAGRGPPQIQSYSGWFLTNHHVLDIFVPTSNPKIRLDPGPTTDLINVINSKREEILDQQMEHSTEILTPSVWSYIVKPLYPLMRITHIALAILVVAPAGVVLNLVEAAWKCYSLPADEDIANIAKGYFQAICYDTVAVLSATFSVHLLVYGISQLVAISTLSYGILFVAFCVGCVAFALYAFGILDGSYTIAMLAAPDTDRAALYIALELRRRLGIVDFDGQLLLPQGIVLEDGTPNDQEEQLRFLLNKLKDKFKDKRDKIGGALENLENDDPLNNWGALAGKTVEEKKMWLETRRDLAADNDRIIWEIAEGAKSVAGDYESYTPTAVFHVLLLIFL